MEPDEAAAAAGIDPTAVENAAPTWTAGAKRFGELQARARAATRSTERGCA